jgi:hypothetical protein
MPRSGERNRLSIGLVLIGVLALVQAFDTAAIGVAEIVEPDTESEFSRGLSKRAAHRAFWTAGASGLAGLVLVGGGRVARRGARMIVPALTIPALRTAGRNFLPVASPGPHHRQDSRQVAVLPGAVNAISPGKGPPGSRPRPHGGPVRPCPGKRNGSCPGGRTMSRRAAPGRPNLPSRF